MGTTLAVQFSHRLLLLGGKNLWCATSDIELARDCGQQLFVPVWLDE